jgi:DNA-binding transcriptional regulator YiaG
MTKETFKILLKQANLNKKELAEVLGIAQQTVNCWGSTQNIPYWVESWLENYIKAKSYEDVKNKIFEIEKIEHKSLGDE